MKNFVIKKDEDVDVVLKHLSKGLMCTVHFETNELAKAYFDVIGKALREVYDQLATSADRTKFLEELVAKLNEKVPFHLRETKELDGYYTLMFDGLVIKVEEDFVKHINELVSRGKTKVIRDGKESDSSID